MKKQGDEKRRFLWSDLTKPAHPDKRIRDITTDSILAIVVIFRAFFCHLILNSQVGAVTGSA
jgi:hypothetical protein